MTTVIDLTTNHDQVENNGVTIVDNAGKFSGTKALYFDGNSYMHFPTSAASVSSLPACIEAWVKPEINDTAHYDRNHNFHSYGIITKGRPKINTGNNFGLYLHRSSSSAHHFMFKSYTSNSNDSISSQSSLGSINTLNYTPQWYHMALTIEQSGSNNVFKMYINGSSAGSEHQLNTSTNLTSNDHYLTIGAYINYANVATPNYGYSNKFKGYMTDIRLTYGEIIYTENFDPPNQPHPKNY